MLVRHCRFTFPSCAHTYIEVDVEEVQDSSKDNLSRSATRRGIPSIDVLSGKGAALLRSGVPGSTSEQNLSTQPHGLNEEDRRKSDDVVARATPEKTLRALSLKEKFSRLSLRDDNSRAQQSERRHRSMDIPPGSIGRDGYLIQRENEPKTSRISSRHRESLSSNSTLDQPQTEREITSVPTVTQQKSQQIGSHGKTYAAPDSNRHALSHNPIPKIYTSQSNSTPLPESSPPWQPMYPTQISQSPLSPVTTSSTFTATAVPPSNYEHYNAENIYAYDAAIPRQTRHVTSSLDSNLWAPAQPQYSVAPSQPSNNPYYQGPSHETHEKMDLEMEFAVQISLADQEEEEREEQERLKRALEESRREAYWY